MTLRWLMDAITGVHEASAARNKKGLGRHVI